MKILHLPIQFCLHVCRQSYFWVLISCYSNSKICYRYMAQYCKGAGRTAIAVDARQPFNWLSSLLEADVLPRNCILWHCSSTDFLQFIWNPRFWIKYSRESYASVSSSFKEAIGRILLRKIISRTSGFLNREMGILINFVNILGACPKAMQRQRKWLE